MSVSASLASNSRNRLACASCTRRKVKCSKTVPCSNCVRRGEQDTCVLGSTETDSSTVVDSRASPQHRSPSDAARQLHVLHRRIAELEAEVQRATSGTALQHNPPPAEDEETSHEVLHLDPTLNPPESITHRTDVQNNRLDSSDAVMKDAASILEFLAWGRHKDPEYHSTVSPEATLTAGTASGDVWDKGSHVIESAIDPFGDCSQLSVIQLLLPSPQQVWQLVQYHEECLLWYHGSFFAPSFRDQLEAFYADYGGMIDRPGVNLQWVALLFSIMTGSLVCSPPATLQSWGFRDPERRTLSKRWFGAVLTCLNRADYTANLSILSCQAIATNTISAHLLGFSSSQSIQLAAAVRIAQSLGLHRLGSETTRNTIDREIGRRVWCQLCSQDWFGIPFSESYLINPLYSTSEPPLNCHDQDLLPLTVDTPTITSYCRFLREVASIIPQLQDDLMVRNTAYTRYEQVLAWDARLRTLVTTERPMFLSHVPIDPKWPCWIPWARRALAISSGHKIIMIHRSFLSDSFINPAFAFTRRTCLAASKTIIKEYKCVADEDGPTLWIHQAFSVAASVILLLDVLHRDPNDRESAAHKQLAESVIAILHNHRNSMIAVRGIKLLGALLAEVSKVASTSGAPNQGRKRRRHDDTFGSSNADIPRNSRSGYKFDLPGFVKTFSVGPASSQSAGSSRSAGQHQSQMDVQVEDPQESDDVGEPGGKDAGHIIEPSLGYSFNTVGLDGANSLENLLYLVNHDCFSVP